MTGELDLNISPESQAQAIVARHRRMAQRAGLNPNVVDSPAYRAMLTRSAPPNVSAAILAVLPVPSNE